MFTHSIHLDKPVGIPDLSNRTTRGRSHYEMAVLHLFTNARRWSVFRPREQKQIPIRIFHNEVRRPPRLFLQRLMELDTR